MDDLILSGTCIGGTYEQGKYTLFIVSLGTVVLAEIEYQDGIEQLIRSSPTSVKLRFQDIRVDWSTETLILEGCTVTA